MQRVAVRLAQLTVIVRRAIQLVRVHGRGTLHRLLRLGRRLLLRLLRRRLTVRGTGTVAIRLLRLLGVNAAHRQVTERLERTRLPLGGQAAALGYGAIDRRGRHSHLRRALGGGHLALALRLLGRRDDIHKVLVHKLSLVEALALGDLRDQRPHRILKLHLEAGEDSLGDKRGSHVCT